MKATKTIFDHVNVLSPEAIRVHAKAANKAVLAMRRAASEMLMESNTREAVLREALHGELIDYEASAARCFERARLAHDGAAQSPLDAARAAVAAIDASMAQLCAHARDAPEDTQMLAHLTNAVNSCGDAAVV